MTEVTTAVILAAGEGRRLEPLTNRRPKPMLPIVDQPLLEYVLEAVVDAGIEHVVFVVGYERDRIQTHFGDGDDWDVEISYALQETQLGTGHAVVQAESLVDGPFLVLNGDRIIDTETVQSVRSALQSGDDGPAMAVTRSATPSEYGVVNVQGDRVVDLVEKPREPASDLINAGVYGFTQAVFEAIRGTPTDDDGEQSITATIDRLLADGTVRAVRNDGLWLDVSHLWDLPSVTGRMLDRDGGAVAGSVAESATVADATHLASGSRVGANATIGRGTTLADNASVGANAVVERSVVFPDATVGPGAVLRDCIVGANATIGANATVPGGEATVIVEGTVHEDVRLGGVIGDNASIGGGAVLDPGAILYDDAEVAPGASASGTVGEGTVIRRG
ncbi:nucleotidyl transferase [Salinarchaeum sp. Harcht-Bsk1]|uniref:sugar phosphate nucleotidyltransferase n=1 Tax=Salinarchaeum sp. Harcht-Bsk1 TaxID=1333523 RepID=UPI0003423433|nr:sugar phosphate nucleotidyltransferase [Salinarchaeum sp. Harcht-Bsk1]AGN00921.1 nucleotidyl transferase [Salinarchaeum sp. Harcht-Bsk1]